MTYSKEVDNLLTQCNFDWHLKKVQAKVSNLKSRVDSEIREQTYASSTRAPSYVSSRPYRLHTGERSSHSRLDYNIKNNVMRNSSVGKAYTTAKKFHKELINAENAFKASGDKSTFLDSCTRALSKAEPELAQHRGWKPVLQGFINIFLKLFGKEVSLQTDSGKILYNLKESLESIDEKPLDGNTGPKMS